MVVSWRERKVLASPAHNSRLDLILRSDPGYVRQTHCAGTLEAIIHEGPLVRPRGARSQGPSQRGLLVARAPRWRRNRVSAAGAQTMVFAERAALGLAVDELQEPADGARTLFFTHRMRLGSC